VSCDSVTARCDHRSWLLVTTQAPVASPSDQSPRDVVQFNLKDVLAGLSKTDAPRQGSSFVTQTPSCRAAQRTLDGLWVWPAKEGHPLVPPKTGLVKITSRRPVSVKFLVTSRRQTTWTQNAASVPLRWASYWRRRKGVSWLRHCSANADTHFEGEVHPLHEVYNMAVLELLPLQTLTKQQGLVGGSSRQPILH
jgi:hypothetical protein